MGPPYENLIRKELTALERPEQLAARKLLFGETGEKLSSLGGRGVVGFASEISDVVGLSKDAINKDLAIFAGIPKQLRDEIRGTLMEDSRCRSRRREGPVETLCRGGIPPAKFANILAT